MEAPRPFSFHGLTLLLPPGARIAIEDTPPIAAFHIQGPTVSVPGRLEGHAYWIDVGFRPNPDGLPADVWVSRYVIPESRASAESSAVSFAGLPAIELRSANPSAARIDLFISVNRQLWILSWTDLYGPHVDPLAEVRRDVQSLILASVRFGSTPGSASVAGL